MSRLASLLIVLLAIAVATPVLAEDRLSLSGAMRVRGFHIDQDKNPVTGAKIDSTDTFADQRLRIGGKMSVAEGVSASFRMDFADGGWGTAGSQWNSNAEDAIEIDRAHLDLQNDMFHLRGGQQKFDLGGTGAFDNQSAGLLLNIKGAVPVTIFGAVDDTNGTTVNGGPRTDALSFGVNVGHKTDAYAANVYAATQRDSSRDDYSFQGVLYDSADEELYLVGLNYAQNFDAIKLFTELNYFTGDAVATATTGTFAGTTDKVDAYGLQAFVDVSTALSETVTLGGQFFYAMGKDDEVQITNLGNRFDGWDPIFTIGTSSNLTTSSIWGYDSVYNVLGNGAGIYAGRLYTSVKASDQISLAGSVFYGTHDEKDSAAFKNILAVAAGLKYDFMPKTFINFQVQYRDLSKENVTADLERFDVGTALVVNF